MIREYTNYLLYVKGYSQRTAEGYAKDVRAFAIWAHANVTNARWSTITREHIDQYVIGLAAAGLSPATTNRKLSALSGLYKYMKRQGLTVTNPIRWESRRKQGQRIPNTIKREELETAYEHSAGVAKVMLGILMTTGIRIQELLDITKGDIDYETGAIRVIGKGNKQRTVFSTPSKLELMHLYTDQLSSTDKVFGNIDQRSARMLIYQALKPYSTAKQLSPHAIRHTFATLMAGNGANSTSIAELMGHQSIDTTQKYIDMANTNLHQQYNNYKPFN